MHIGNGSANNMCGESIKGPTKKTHKKNNGYAQSHLKVKFPPSFTCYAN